MKTIQLLKIAASSATLLLAAVAARATVIDFDTLPLGPITTVGDATFSLAGVGEAGAPVNASNGGTNYLWNSSDGVFYPTNTILRVDFATGVGGVEFAFNPFGINGNSNQGWSLLDAANAVIASGSYSSGGGAYYNLSSYTGVYAIEWHNGQNNWLQGLDSLTYVATPDGGSTALLIVGALFALGAMKRKSRLA